MLSAPRDTMEVSHLGTRNVWFVRADTAAEDAAGWVETPIYARDGLTAGQALDGPAIVEEAGGTTIVPPGWRVNVMEGGTLLCRRSAD